MAIEVISAPHSKTAEPILDSQDTTCCIVGGGPGGMMLALLLARKGIPVTLLEAHKDFDRDFRGDTIHPSILEILDEIGLAEENGSDGVLLEVQRHAHDAVRQLEQLARHARLEAVDARDAVSDRDHRSGLGNVDCAFVILDLFA